MKMLRIEVSVPLIVLTTKHLISLSLHDSQPHLHIPPLVGGHSHLRRRLAVRTEQRPLAAFVRGLRWGWRAVLALVKEVSIVGVHEGREAGMKKLEGVGAGVLEMRALRLDEVRSQD